MKFQEYSWFKDKRTELAGLMEESSAIIQDLSMKKFSERLRQLSEKTNNDSFRVQVIGTFKNGKSTFINALLGEDILPRRVLPCTAVVNEIKYGEEKRAVLHFRNPLPEQLIDTIPAATLEHMRKHGMKDIPPMEIEYDRIWDYVTIPVKGNPEEIAAASPYLSVELFYPSPLLKEGVEIVDSPGFNEAEERTQCTLDYLEKADAVIYLLDSTKACAEDEMETITDILLPKGFKDIFFVANKFDWVPQQEQDEVRRYVTSTVGHLTTNAVYFVSALNGLEGKIENDAEKYASSGMAVFEQRLSEFLTKDKGRIKLTQPARELNNILSREALYRTIPALRQQLASSLDELMAKYNTIQPQLNELEDQKRQMKNNTELQIERCLSEVRRAISQEYHQIANQIPVWILNYQPKSKVGWGTRKKLEKLINEIMEHVNEQVKETYKTWSEQILVPLIQQRAEEIYKSSGEELKGMQEAIDSIYSQISNGTIQVEGAKGWERAAGFLISTFFAAGTGASIMINGFKDKSVIKNLAVDLGVGAGIFLLGIVNPYFILAAVVAVIWRAIAGGERQALADIKNKLIEAVPSSVISEAPKNTDKTISKLREELMKIADGAVESIDVELDNIKSQMDEVVSDLQRGNDHVSKKNDLIDRSEARLRSICDRLNTMVFELAELK